MTIRTIKSASTAIALAGLGFLAASNIAQRRTNGVSRQGESLEIAGLKVSVWKPATGQRWPLVIFSHGFSGTSTQSTFLTGALAEHGYLVFAPNHLDSIIGGRRGQPRLPQAPFWTPEPWNESTNRDRADDIASLIKALKTDPSWSAKIDFDKIALAGHSLGGYTALGLAGAWPGWRHKDVKAVLALSPFCSPFVEKKTLSSLKVPVMYQGGTFDFGITPFIIKKDGAFDQTPKPVTFVKFEKAGHFAWTDLNPKYHKSIILYSLAFLDKHLKGIDKSTSKPADVADLRSK